MPTLKADLSAEYAPADSSHPPLSDSITRVPNSLRLREQLRDTCIAAASKFDRTCPLAQGELAAAARDVLGKFDLPDDYLGWTMVILTSSFWKDRVAAVPPSRRLFVLPAAAANNGIGNGEPRSEAATCDELRRLAEELGYQTATIDRSATLLKIILSGSVEAVLGVASLELLQRAFDKIRLAGMPCMAVPLLSSDANQFAVDRAWVADMLCLAYQPAQIESRSYVHLVRCARAMFERPELERLAPRVHVGASAELNGHAAADLDPISGTETIAYDFLARGGKYSRPFITLAVYDALTGGHGAGSDGAAHLAALPDAVKRATIAIETFHKASLVHDDIEDDDPFRYGMETLHRRFGTATAINVGDYLIGLGYRCVTRQSRTLGADVVADILDCLADAHMRLCEGQGAELLWRDSRRRQLAAEDALRIYALKTAPAFEAALFTGMRLAGPADAYREQVARFARHLGIAFQILNDLGDWRGDGHNKLLAGGDVLGGRPTVLWALALRSLPETQRIRLQELADRTPTTADVVEQVRALYDQADVFAQAKALVAEHQAQAEAIAAEMTPKSLRDLLCYLVEAVLDRQSGPVLPGR